MIAQAFWEMWLSGDLVSLMTLFVLALPLVVVGAGVAWLRDLWNDRRGK